MHRQGGRYTISGLGPCEWRVQFPDYSGKYAWTWSGGAANRLDAAEVIVRGGQSATVDAALPATGLVTGKLIGATLPPEYTTVLAIDPRTGEYASPRGFVRSDGQYTVTGLGTREVTLWYDVSLTGPPANSEPIKVVAGTTVTLDLPVPH